MKIITAKDFQQLQEIIELQIQNLEANISLKELKEQGFVTVEHDLNTLKKISGKYEHVIAVDDQAAIAGYVLVMLKEFGQSIPVLVPMFNIINTLTFENKKLASAAYFVIGQVCIAKAYRGQGLFEKLYEALSDQMKEEFDYMITEVAERNRRSLIAHFKQGFQTMHTYQSDIGEIWQILLKKIK